MMNLNSGRSVFWASAESLTHFRSAKICKILRDPQFDKEKFQEYWSEFMDIYWTASENLDFTCEKDMLLSANTLDAVKCIIESYKDEYSHIKYDMQDYLAEKIREMSRNDNVDVKTFEYVTNVFLEDVELPNHKGNITFKNLYNSNASDEYNYAAERFLQKYFEKGDEYVKKEYAEPFIEAYNNFLNGNFDIELRKNIGYHKKKEVEMLIFDLCVKSYNNTKKRKNIPKLLKKLECNIAMADIKKCALSK